MGSFVSSAALPAPAAAALSEEASLVGAACYPHGGRPDLGYGTAGFRTLGDQLDHVMYRMGILAALRSKVLGGRPVGVMITASHNPEKDNGVKLVEPMGEMLVPEWEAHATKLANASDCGFAEVLKELILSLSVDLSVSATVFVGRDTRASSVRLALAVCDGIGAMRPSSCRSISLATTPQLHYAVRCAETNGAYGLPSLVGYRDKLLNAYALLVQSRSAAPQKYKPHVVVDCANGVGAIALKQMLEKAREIGLNVELRNEGAGGLNEGCGADFVKIKQAAPSGVTLTPGLRYVSVDGDADRIVYYFSQQGTFRLLDGDRIALLLVHYLAKLLKEAGIEGLRLGLVQTAYANGASTACAVESLGADNVLCAKTGVKHCHHAALALDIGAYYEANGHGTVLFSDACAAKVTAAAAGTGPTAASAKQILLLRDVINEAVGDAIGNLLAVEAVLSLLDWSCDEWLAMYTDLPNRQIKVVVKDRGAFETTNAERTCVKPEGLQQEIDRLVSQAPGNRAFVRPSGTEDVVRVYVEAATLPATIALGQAVVDLVYTKAGGVGTKPTVS